jgi:hypothetical protein
MDTVKQFKNSPEIRNYWAEKKRQERARAKEGNVNIQAERRI